jgi:hypothetical protein
MSPRGAAVAEPVDVTQRDTVEQVEAADAAVLTTDVAELVGEPEEAPDASDEQVPEPEPIPESLSRYAAPSVATARHLLKMLRERLQTIEGGIWDEEGLSWNGVEVITNADLLAVFGQELPVPSAFSAESRSGGRILNWTACPNCHELVPIEVYVGSELKLTGEGTAKLKPTFKAEARDHHCYQRVLPLDEPVPGQTEAFDEEGSTSSEPPSEAENESESGLNAPGIEDDEPDAVASVDDQVDDVDDDLLP